jgi:tetratricopeptide (TPR) repeat protein
MTAIKTCIKWKFFTLPVLFVLMIFPVVLVKAQTADVYRNKGFELLDQGKYQQALDNFESALQINSKDAVAHAGKGDALRRLKRFSDALASYKKAVELNPRYEVVYELMATAYYELSDYDNANISIKQAIKLNPKNAGLYVSKSWYCSFAGYPEFALEAAEEAIRLDPNDAMAYTNKARALNTLASNSKNRADGIKLYAESVKTGKKAFKLWDQSRDNLGYGETNVYLGMAYQGLDQTAIATAAFQEAIAWFEKHLKTGSKNYNKSAAEDADQWYLWGNAYYQLSNYAEARNKFETANNLRENFVKALYNLGMTYHKLGKENAALGVCKKLRELGKDKDADLCLSEIGKK